MSAKTRWGESAKEEDTYIISNLSVHYQRKKGDHTETTLSKGSKLTSPIGGQMEFHAS